MNIRIAGEADAAALAAIYAPYVTNTAITFEYEPPTAEEFACRIRRTLERYPYFVAEENGVIAGYTYVSPFRARAAYDWSVETSIYIREGCKGKGLGKSLYFALESMLQRQNVVNLNACIVYPHPESVAFHERMGYTLTAHIHQCGYKLGKWHDIVWMEKMLGAHDTPPRPFIPFRELAAESVQKDM